MIRSSITRELLHSDLDSFPFGSPISQTWRETGHDSHLSEMLRCRCRFSSSSCCSWDISSAILSSMLYPPDTTPPWSVDAGQVRSGHVTHRTVLVCCDRSGQVRHHAALVCGYRSGQVTHRTALVCGRRSFQVRHHLVCGHSSGQVRVGQVTQVRSGQPRSI